MRLTIPLALALAVAIHAQALGAQQPDTTRRAPARSTRPPGDSAAARPPVRAGQQPVSDSAVQLPAPAPQDVPAAEPPLPPPSPWVVAAARDSAQKAARERAAGRVQSFKSDFNAGFFGTLHTIEAPLRWSGREWLLLPAGGIGLAALSRVDQPLHRIVDRNRSGFLDDGLSLIEPMGAKGAIALVVGTYAVGLALDQPAVRRTGVEAATSSVVAAGLVTPGLKLLVGRSRPWEGKGAYAFHSFSSHESFPSGHTTQAFAAASVFAAEAHSRAARVAIYALAGGVACARLYHDAHFLSDVAAAAAIGTVTGRAVVRLERAHPGSWLPYVDGERVGIALRVR